MSYTWVFQSGNLKTRYNVGEKSRWEDGVKMYLKELGCDGVDWINLAPDGDQW
jgi:hypothetical protein